jgi:SAM-dependent methyltransferase
MGADERGCNGVSRINDVEVVRREYASLERLARRRLDATGWLRGIDEIDAFLEAVAEVRPGRVLDAGSGPGDYAVLLAAPEVVCLDQSEASVEAARQRGLDARRGDIQQLPFTDGQFDVVVCNHVLYHLPDRERGFAELARVLRPGGRLVGIYHFLDHLEEVWDAVGDPWRAEPGWGCEDADELEDYVARVECRETHGSVVWLTRDDLQAYFDAYLELLGPLEAPDEPYPFFARRHNGVIVAEKA